MMETLKTTTCSMVHTFNSTSEEWKDIKGFENIYQISNLGRIKSLKRYGRREEKILTPVVGKRGYYTVSLWYKQNGKTLTIHRLIAEHFIPNPENKREVNHKDANKLNNSINNLEWVTPKENSIHAVRSINVRKFKHKRGASKYIYNNKITWVAEIRFDNKLYQLGRFKNKEDAHHAYKLKYIELYGFSPW